eukprot:CAMPEP_0185602686 /NCGR_PEP_ID=MMETSP0436-20130131/1949_1 /TAXON_ID=626734 ORGANISM="Favella taraikaensis, Strain Fe Narragansett Bay" /NCGR_SAMPLE_ID=MMETSP0436 /ASSEMBLY_ACC=CAM_ASM_000390 /LENGTH=114 /DNA_ID=CAMNT_0028232955 /DNA_START=536 /DNA_END=881 /DNA_ORIENTATION=-
MAVESSTGAPVDVKCSRCDMAFCFGCTKNAHMPIDCEGLSTWDDRINNNEDDSNNWMKINTKPCPKCKSPIEKNQGCMHMTAASVATSSAGSAWATTEITARRLAKASATRLKM